MSIKHSKTFDSTDSFDSQYYSEKSDSPEPGQLTTTTVISLAPDFNFKQNPDGDNNKGFDKQKSMESVLSTASECEALLKKEKWYSVSIQIFIPFMIAGIGTIGAGLVLGQVEVQYYKKLDIRSNYVIYRNTKSSMK